MPDGAASVTQSVEPAPTSDEAEFQELLERLREAGLGAVNRTIGVVAADERLDNSVWNEVASTMFTATEAGHAIVEANISIGGFVPDQTAPLSIRIRKGDEVIRTIGAPEALILVNNQGGDDARPQPLPLSAGVDMAAGETATFFVDVFTTSAHLFYVSLHSISANEHQIQAWDGTRPHNRLTDADIFQQTLISTDWLALEFRGTDLWEYDRYTTGDAGDPSRLGALSRAMRVDSPGAIVANSWHLTGATDTWGTTSRLLFIDVSASERSTLETVANGSSCTILASNAQFADCTLSSIFYFTLSNGVMRARIEATPIDGRTEGTPPTMGAIQFEYVTAGSMGTQMIHSQLRAWTQNPNAPRRYIPSSTRVLPIPPTPIPAAPGTGVTASMTIYDGVLYLWVRNMPNIIRAYDVTGSGPPTAVTSKDISIPASFVTEVGADPASRPQIISAQGVLWFGYNYDSGDTSDGVFQLRAFNLNDGSRRAVSDLTILSDDDFNRRGSRFNSPFFTDGNIIWVSYLLEFGSHRMRAFAITQPDKALLDAPALDWTASAPLDRRRDTASRIVDPRTVLKGSYILATEV